jgi:hypothetical protein
MEADWEFEVGGNGPVIEAWWPGFFDLRSNPEFINQIPEVAELPALGRILVRLNADASRIWTSKCGVWELSDPDRFDPDELNAPAGGTAHACCCYVDLLPKSDAQWPDPDSIADDCKVWCTQFHAVPLRSCRVDLVVRRAFFLPDRMGLGITAYVTGCGATPGEAQAALQAALESFGDVLCGRSPLQ